MNKQDNLKIEFDILQRAILEARNVINNEKCTAEFNKGYMKGRYDAIIAIKNLLPNLKDDAK